MTFPRVRAAAAYISVRHNFAWAWSLLHPPAPVAKLLAYNVRQDTVALACMFRDVKMENVLLGFDKEEGRLIAKLTDFGLHVVS